MVDAITPQRMSLLQLLSKHPDLSRERLLALKGVAAEDLAYLEQHDLVRTRDADRYRVSHLGAMVLKRGL